MLTQLRVETISAAVVFLTDMFLYVTLISISLSSFVYTCSWVVFWPTFSSRPKFADIVLCKIFMYCSIQYFASVSNNMFRASQ